VNWELGWSTGKKRWCCEKESRACDPFHCDEGLESFVSDWTEAKRAWCCDKHDKGCTTTTTPAPYDCNAGYQHWEVGWSDSKKHWCCANANKACDAFDCQEGFSSWQTTWQESKRSWCCDKHSKGCTTTSTTSLPYDCKAGVKNWELGFSATKKQWCCAREQVACDPFDCAEGFANWQTAWHESKRSWCCEHHSQGCTTTGTTSSPYDCKAGLSNWQVGWSEAKKAYCCQSGRATCIKAVKAACVLWGDPHVKTFDQSRSVFYSEGDFWIVKSKAVKIQGRFQATDWTKENDHTDYSSMTSVIVSGSFMQGHKIQVDSMLGSIKCDSSDILANFGQATCGTAKITFDSVGDLVDSAMAFLPHKVVHMLLPGSTEIQVNRWPNFINAKIQMRKQVEQDGVCGNFNGNPQDDQGKNLHQRFGHGVSQGECLFGNRIPEHTPVKLPNSKRCSPERLKRAQSICHQAAAADGWSFPECLGDVCDEHTHAPSVQAQEMQHMAKKALR